MQRKFPAPDIKVKKEGHEFCGNCEISRRAQARDSWSSGKRIYMYNQKFFPPTITKLASVPETREFSFNNHNLYLVKA